MNPNYYGILPANVRYDNRLVPMARILYTEISALSNKHGECFAGNEYFADLYNKAPETISRWISSLVKYNYVKRRYTYRKGTKEIEKRWLQIHQEVLTKSSRGYKQKNQGGIDEKVKDNNTSINNTSIIDSVKENFDKFRKLWRSKMKGKAGGLDTEYSNWKAKTSGDEELLKRMFDAANHYYQEKIKEFPDGNFKYVPALSVWINQKRWEHYEE